VGGARVDAVPAGVGEARPVTRRPDVAVSSSSGA